MVFSEKRILLISPERWGTSQLSKHHYAVALAEKGNQVYFLNPPTRGLRKVLLTQTGIAGLTLVDYSQTIRGLNNVLPILPNLFSLLSSIDVRRILRKLSFQPDVVWSFDPFRFQHLKLFKAAITIFHPVDYFYKSKIDLIPARYADIIFSVTPPILDRYKLIATPAFLINHGVSPTYLRQKKEIDKGDSTIRCGYVGNLLSFGIHWKNLVQIISENRHVEFHFIGPYSENNLGTNNDARIHLGEIKKHDNVIFHGEMPPREVAKKIQKFDLFLICYDPENVGNVVSNSHKILEYLSTGKVVVSSRMTAYDNQADDLFEMVMESTQLPAKFNAVVKNILSHNSLEKQTKRIAFATLNSYENHLQTIEKLITEHIEKT